MLWIGKGTTSSRATKVATIQAASAADARNFLSPRQAQSQAEARAPWESKSTG
jgi:hypothetical protein